MSFGRDDVLIPEPLAGLLLTLVRQRRRYQAVGSPTTQDWLAECAVKIAAMDRPRRTGSRRLLPQEVMAIWLLNAAHMKAVPGRKDVRDAEWIAQLLKRTAGAFVRATAAESGGCGC